MSWKTLRSLLLGLTIANVAACSSESASDEDETDGPSEDELRATLGTANLDPTKPARIILVGDASHLGDQPLHAALARGRRYREASPNDQVVLYLTDEVTANQAKRFGLNVVPADFAKMRGKAIVESLTHFKAIVSIDFVGHSSPFGISLDHASGDTNIKANTPNVDSLSQNFDRTRNPYVAFNGCNAGIEAARLLSIAWKVPISGAFTGSNFERLHTDGHWYADIDGQTPSKAFATTNDKAFKTPVDCSQGACYRLRPMNYPYNGYWGVFGRGLGHYKFFCAEDEATCKKGMAHAMLGFVSVRPLTLASSREDFEAVVLDYLCPTSADPETYARCAREIPRAAASGEGFTPFSNPDKVVECTLTSCDATIACRKDAAGEPQPHTCSIKAPPAPAQSHTTPNEYQLLMSGFDLIRTR
jgi:hypothetical protein